MVALEAVRASNNQIRQLPSGLVALFVGGTSGIGESTAKQFCRYAIKPSVYIVGRNGEAASRIITELKGIQAEGKYSFIQKDVSLIRNVDEVCNEIKSKESKVNILFMTQGILSLKSRNETSEGLDAKMSAHYYSRLRFAQQLLPQLQAASPQLSRVVSVLSPGSGPSTIDFDNLGLRTGFSLSKAAGYCSTMTDFAFEELARENPTVSFVHTYPGAVRTSLMRHPSFFVRAGMNILMTLMAPWEVKIDESGERHVYAATSDRYPSQAGPQGGVPIEDGEVMKGGNGKTGSGSYLLGTEGEFRGKENLLQKLRDSGAGPKIWEHTVKEFENVK